MCKVGLYFAAFAAGVLVALAIDGLTRSSVAGLAGEVRPVQERGAVKLWIEGTKPTVLHPPTRGSAPLRPLQLRRRIHKRSWSLRSRVQSIISAEAVEPSKKTESLQDLFGGNQGSEHFSKLCFHVRRQPTNRSPRRQAESLGLERAQGLPARHTRKRCLI